MVIYPMDSSLRSWRDWQRVLLFFGSRAAYPGHSNLASSRSSDRGDGAKRCEQKKKHLIFFSPSSFASHSTIRTPGTGYINPAGYAR